MDRFITIVVLVLVAASAGAQQKTGFKIVERPAEKQVDIIYNNRLLTAYTYYDSSRKPILFPVNTIDGVTVTRGYPFRSVAGERTDHPHHTGIWFNYESVNGLDFWNNSTAIPVDQRHRYGTIRHQAITGKAAAGGDNAALNTTAIWVAPNNRVLMHEKNTFNFSVKGNDFIIDRITTLTATDTAVVFKDVKDGLLAIRVARELEMPSKERSKYVDEHGNVVTDPTVGTGEVTGMYYGSNGLKGDSVWSSKGEWTMLTGRKDGKNITIAIIDHPSNVGYPSYWHARGYGLFAINPFGRKTFSNGKEELNFTLSAGQSTTFKYRVIIRSGTPLTKTDINNLAAEFAKR